MSPFRVLVCGGRDYSDSVAVAACLGLLRAKHGPLCIIEGGASGADALAGEWAKTTCSMLREYPAEWRKYGPRAGPIRNRQMLDEGRPDIVVAFPGGRGTGDMVRRAIRAGVTVLDLRDELRPQDAKEVDSGGVA